MINGPVSVFRLEGTIDNVNKIIYLFGDVHIKITKESECKPKTKETIITYILENVKESKEICDVFIEIANYIPLQQLKKYVDNISKSTAINMIQEVQNILFENINIRQEYGKYKNIGSKIKNVRFHYLDIRAYICKLLEFMEMDFNFDINYDKISNYTKFLTLIIEFCYMLNEVYFIKKTLIKKIKNEDINDNHEEIYELINTIKDIDDEYVNNRINRYNTEVKEFDVYNRIKYIINKIFENDILKESIFVKEILGYIDDLIEKLLKLIVLIKKYLLNKNNIDKKADKNEDYVIIIFNEIKIVKDDIETNILYLCALFTDLYCMRRVCYKPYIKKAIIYSGNAHTNNYLFYLIKYHDFKITHFDNNSLENKNITSYELENLIKDGKYIFKKLYENNKLLVKQCVDMSEFPKKFE